MQREYGNLTLMICAQYFQVNYSFSDRWIRLCINFHPNAEKFFETLSQDGKIAVASSITVFVVISILFFIIGFLSRSFCCKERKTAGMPSPTEQPQIPYYDDVVLKQREEQALELKENLAYAQPVLSQTNNN